MKTKKRVGRNMKPRETQASSAEMPVAASEAVETLSTTAVQPEGAVEAPAAPSEGVKTPGSLEGDSLQNLESGEVAEAESINALGKLLQESAKAETEKKCPTIDDDGDGDCQVCTSAAYKQRMAEDDASKPNLKMPYVVPEGLGLQPDGSYRAPVTIPEGYLEAVKEWAAAEDKTVERWLDDQFLAMMEAYGMPAKGR